jgi:PAS domain S-box-containing protein
MTNNNGDLNHFIGRLNDIYQWVESVDQPNTGSTDEEHQNWETARREFRRMLEEVHDLHETWQSQQEDLLLARTALERERQRYLELFEFAPDGYLVTDRYGLIRQANRAASELLNVRQEALVGKPLGVYIALDDRPAFRKQLATFFTKPDLPGLEEWEVTLQPRRAAPFPALLRLGFYHSDQGRDHLLWLIRDITLRKEAEIELTEVRQQLAASRDAIQRHLARELHDTVIQAMVGLSYRLANQRRQLSQPDAPPPDPTTLLETLKTAEQAVLGLVGLLRGFIGLLRPENLEEFGLTAALQTFVARLQREGQPDLPAIILDIDQTSIQLPPTIANALFRSAQEAIRNALNHAAATQIYLRLQLSPTSASLIISDNGRGFQLPTTLNHLARQGHYGLIGMQERLALLTGTVTIETEPDHGTTIFITVPLPPPALKYVSPSRDDS